jgi:endonuclease G, mitochondrial
MRTLIFIHGRGQQGRKPNALRQRWAAGLNKGLTAAGRDPLDTAAIEAIGFPFYGDVLWAAVVQGRAAVPDVAALDAVQQVDPGLPDAVNRRQVAVLQAMARERGVQPAVEPAAMLAIPTWPLLRGLLEWVANHSGVDEAVIRDFLRDVSAYLELPGCRAAVQEVVRPALLTDPDSVLVGHSLGGLVCAELLAEDEVRDRVAVFVAIGAPLGLDAVTDGMRPAGSARPTSPWVNVFDLRDWVTLGSPLHPGGGLRQQLAVANPRSYEHSIEHYLAHPEVATVIAEALDARAWLPEAPIQDLPPG